MRNILVPLLLCLCGLYFGGCSDDPTSLGRDFFSGQNLKLDSLIINSGSDSVQSASYYKSTPLNSATYLLVGNVEGSELVHAWTSLLFTPRYASYNDSIKNGTIKIVRAQLYLTPLYNYGDTNQTFQMGYSTITHGWTEAGFTSDSATQWDDKIFVPGSLSSTNDTMEITHLETVLSWMKGCVDTPYTEYGILLKPASSVNNRIIGFDAYTSPPILKIWIQGPSGVLTDSASYYAIVQSHVVLPSPSPAGDSAAGLVLKNGISSHARLSYSLSALPANAIINSAVLTLVCDTINSKWGEVSGSFYKSSLYAFSEYDSTVRFIPDASYNGILTATNNIYSGSILNVVNRDYLRAKNLTVVLRSATYEDGVEKYVFYDPGNTDRSKKPLLKIYYTKRGSK